MKITGTAFTQVDDAVVKVGFGTLGVDPATWKMTVNYDEGAKEVEVTTLPAGSSFEVELEGGAADKQIIFQITDAAEGGDLVAFTSLNISNGTPTIGQRTEQELRIDNPKDWTPRSVSGHLYADISSDPQQERIFIIYFPSLIRFHDPLYAHSASSDSTAVDAASADSLSSDSTSLDSVSGSTSDTTSRRLSPEQFRDMQPVDRTIDVVKQKPYQAPRNSNRKRFTQPTAPRRR